MINSNCIYCIIVCYSNMETDDHCASRRPSPRSCGFNRPIPQIPQRIRHISNKTPFCKRNVHIYVTKWSLRVTGLVHRGVCSIGLYVGHG